MKGFIITLVLILLLGAAGFFLGWVQFHVDDGEYAVLFTKTHGWEPEVIYPGNFVWRWQGIFPTLLSRYDFVRTERETDVSILEALPGAELYAEYVPESPDFSWRFETVAVFAVRPDYLPELAENQGLRPENLEDFLDRRESQITSSIIDALPVLIADNAQNAENFGSAADDAPVPPISRIQTQLQDILEERFPELQFTSLFIRRFELPDLELYAIARARYLSVLDTEAAARQRALGELARLELINTAQRESLAALGNILETNPGLLEYLRIVSETGRDPIGLSPLFNDILGNAASLNTVTIPITGAENP
jgi:hypothetical protein